MLGMKNIPKRCLYIKHLKLNSFSAISHTLDPNILKSVSIGLVSKNFSAINDTLIQLFLENICIGLISKKSCLSAINHAWNEKHS